MEMEQIVLPFGQGDQGGSSGVGEETKGGLCHVMSSILLINAIFFTYRINGVKP